MEEPHEEQHSKEMTGSHEKVAGVTPSGEGVAGVTPSGERVAQPDGEQQARPTESKEGVAGPVESNEALQEKTALESFSSPPHSAEPAVMDIVLRYDEQPTMRGEVVMVKPKSTVSPKHAKAKPRKHRDTSMDTVFENAGDETKEEDEKKKKGEKKQAPQKVSVELVEKEDDGAYENLPTPPSEKERKLKKAEEERKKQLKKQKEEEIVEQKTAETEHKRRKREPTSKEKRKHIPVERTSSADSIFEMGTQMQTMKEDMDQFYNDDELATGVDYETELLSPGTGPSQIATRRAIRKIKRLQKESYVRTAIDIFSILCLLPLMNEMWILPVEAVINGGLAFIVAYVIILVLFVHPTLFLVLFVSQCTQRGLVNVFHLYGRVCRGFGYGYVVLIFMAQMSIFHQGQLIIKHGTVVYNDSLSIGICSENFVKNWHECSSLFLDTHCRAAKMNSNFYAEGFCWNRPMKSSSINNSAYSYVRYITEERGGNGIDFPMLGRSAALLAVVTLLAINGPSLLIALLAILAVVFVIMAILDNVHIFNSGAFAKLNALTDFRLLGDPEVWIIAFRLAFSASGLGEVTVFCMSSFRNPRGNCFTTATGVIIGKILIAFLGVLSLTGHLSLLQPFRPEITRDISFFHRDLMFYPGLMAEVYSMFKNYSNQLFDHAEWMLIYHITTSFAAFFMILAIARKQGANKYVERAIFVAAYAIVCMFYFLIMSLEGLRTFATSHRTLVLTCSLYLYMAATISILTFGYGIAEHHRDIREVFRQKYKNFMAVREGCHVVLYSLILLALVIIQIYDLIVIVSLEQEKIDLLISQNKTNDVIQECFSIVLALVPILLPVFFFFYAWFRKKGKPKASSDAQKPTRRRPKDKKTGKKKSSDKKTDEHSGDRGSDSLDEDFKKDEPKMSRARLSTDASTGSGSKEGGHTRQKNS
uniref:Transmembrane protein n=1 Tax=Haemonchus contortus TaxID=6289 RepID=A0A7I4Y539_HAECO